MKTKPPPPAPEPAAPTPPPTPATLARVDVAECQVAPGINRADMAITREFLTDISTRGVISALIVRELLLAAQVDGLRYEIWAGARRWTAAVKASLPDLPVSIYPADTPDKTMAELRLIENLQREDLSVLDEAGQYQEALDRGDYGSGRAGVEALAVRVGKSPSHIYSRLRLLKLPKTLREAWTDGLVPQSIIELLSTLPDEADQVAALEAIAKGEALYDPVTAKVSHHCMSVRQARAYIARQFQSDLRKAIWHLDDPDLYPEAGACTECPLRGGHPGGVAGIDDPNACTRRTCYQKKRDLHLKEKLAEAQAAGKTVLDLSESEKIFRHGCLISMSDYIEPEAKPYLDKAGRTYEQLLKSGKCKSAKAEETLAVHALEPTTGQLVKLYKRDELNDALVAAGHKWAEPIDRAGKPNSEPPEAKAEREAEAALADQVVERTVAAVLKVVENPKITARQHAQLWAFMFSCWIDVMGEPVQKFFKRRGIASSALKAIRNLSAKSDLDLEVVRGQCIEQTLMDYSAYNELAVERLAALCGVDPGAIEKQVRAEAKPRSAAVSPRPAAAATPARKSVESREPRAESRKSRVGAQQARKARSPNPKSPRVNRKSKIVNSPK